MMPEAPGRRKGDEMPEDKKKAKSRPVSEGSHEAVVKTVRGFVDIRDALIKDLDQHRTLLDCRLRETLCEHVKQRQALHAEVQQGFEAMHHEHWLGVSAMSCEERSQPRVLELQRELDASLAEAQETARKQWLELEQRQQEEAEQLTSGFESARLEVFKSYIESLKEAWAGIDPSLMDGGALAVVAQSIVAASHVAAGSASLVQHSPAACFQVAR